MIESEAVTTARNLWNEGRWFTAYDKFYLTRRRKAGEGLIAEAEHVHSDEIVSDMHPEQGGYLSLLYYPHPDDAEHFDRSRASCLGGGPSEYFPGSVGAFHALKSGTKQRTITLLQGCFKKRKAEGGLGDALYRKLIIKKYPAWKEELLREAFADFEKDEVNRVDLQLHAVKKTVEGGGTRIEWRGGGNEEAFRKIAGELGYKVDVIHQGEQSRVLSAVKSEQEAVRKQSLRAGRILKTTASQENKTTK
ncbi:hypothetical protein HZC09_03655 [Candidatus Micrarchaeota archaeon]|nr:hypothetical protein [Candidatus Micrarchaeota archaeon]